MKEDIEKRLTSLRDVMRRERLAAFIFPSTDAHQSEYVPDHWKGREWISGFNGSARAGVGAPSLFHNLRRRRYAVG